MKRVIKTVCLSIALLFGLTSCKSCEGLNNEFRYTNPRKDGGTYTVYQNNLKFEHLRCIYWSTDDDDAIFKDADGIIYYINGTSIIVKE